jgi:hypothetical protein
VRSFISEAVCMEGCPWMENFYEKIAGKRGVLLIKSISRILAEGNHIPKVSNVNF